MNHRDPSSYEFSGYLEALGSNWYASDGLLQSWLADAELDEAETAMVERFGCAVATNYREMAFVVEPRENHPRIANKGPHNVSSQEIIVPPETRQMLAEVQAYGKAR